MRNPLKSPASTSLGLLLARIPVGILFANAAYFKFTKMGVGAFVNMSLDASRKFMPEPLGRAFLYAVPTVEALIGVLMILGLFSRTTGCIASLLLISIMMAVTGASDPGTLVHLNVILLGVTLLLMLSGPGDFALDSLWPRKGGKSKATAE